MMKPIYAFAWVLLAAAIVLTAMTGTFDAPALVAFSLVALALVYTLALYSVIVNTREIKTE